MSIERTNNVGVNRFALGCVAMSGLLLILSLVARGAGHESQPNDGANLSSTASPATLPYLLSMHRSQLSRVEIGVMNVLCAVGLSGSDAINMDSSLVGLDDMASRVKVETARHYRKFQANPKEFTESEAYFRMLCLVTVLQQDFGVGYSPNRARPSEGSIEPNETFFADSRDIFIHGLLGPRRTGTCASLPVLYIAVGRRLGYPLKLVGAKNHLFVRWDNGRERLNIEATTQGLTTFDDAYYRGWPFPMTPEEERTERYLTSLSSEEELSVFLSLRTQCLLAAGRFKEALSCQEQVCRLAPHSSNQKEILEQVTRRAQYQTPNHRNNQTAPNL
jgi:hypothetical protein